MGWTIQEKDLLQIVKVLIYMKVQQIWFNALDLVGNIIILTLTFLINIQIIWRLVDVTMHFQFSFNVIELFFVLTHLPINKIKIHGNIDTVYSKFILIIEIN